MGHDALLFFKKWHRIFYMPSCTDTPRHRPFWGKNDCVGSLSRSFYLPKFPVYGVGVDVHQIQETQSGL